MKKCTKCQTENPQHANFCRRCGKPFVNMATEESQAIDNSHYGQTNHVLDSLRPVNYNDFEEMCFNKISEAIFSVILILIIIFLIGYIFGANIYSRICISLFMGIFPIIKITKYVRLKNELNKNIDFIENEGTIVRVVKQNLMGLYDKETYSILLESLYSRITNFDENHFLLEQNGKKGLFSITYKKIIVPVQYDAISPFNKYITTAAANGVIERYDVMGNKY